MIESYNELPVGKYLEIQEIIKEDMSDIDKQVAIIAVLTDLTENEVLNIPITEYKGYAEKSMFLDRHMDVPKQVASVYEIGDWKLIPTTDIRKMTTAQYIDFQTFSKEGDTKVVETLSCFLVPKGKKYNDDYDIVEVQNAIREHLAIPHCFALIAFFLTRFNHLILGTLIYCKWMTKLTMKKSPQKKEILNKIEELIKGLPNGNYGLDVLMP